METDKITICKRIPKTMKKIFVIVDNHFDLMWRRCFESGIVDKGINYISYSDIEKYYILDNLELAKNNPDYKFQIEGVVVVQNFLKKNPDKYDELMELYKSGRAYTPVTGHNIIDGNMVLGESLIRNFLAGYNWYEENGISQPKLAVRNDAFGNCAQLPQILRGFGIKWLTGLSYIAPEGNYLRGLDGSTVCTLMPRTVGGGGGWAKYAPCDSCSGFGEINGCKCTDCDGRGVDAAKSEKRRTPFTINEDLMNELEYGISIVGGEEFFPFQKTVDIVNSLKEKYDIKFAFQEDVYPLLAEYIENVDSDNLQSIHPSTELNPNSTGCYVSRIRTKQTVRRFEYELFANETLSCMLYLNTGTNKYKFNEEWDLLLYSMFHDAITGTHVDAAFDELAEYWERLDGLLDNKRKKMYNDLSTSNDKKITIINPTADVRYEYKDIPLPENKTVKSIKSDGRCEIILIENYAKDDTNYAKILFKDLNPFSKTELEFEYADEKLENLKINDSTPDFFSGAILGHNNLFTRHIEMREVSIENERFLINADQSGLIEITDKKNNRKISQTEKYRPGELVLENDDGSPWTTFSDDKKDFRMSQYTNLIKIEKTPEMQRLCYNITIPFEFTGVVDHLNTSYTVSLYTGMDRVDFSTDINWHTYHKRMRVAFPLCFDGSHVYEVPSGIIKREPYFPNYYWNGTCGDYPAVNWAGVDGKSYSAAVLNKGTPSYKILHTDIGSMILLSLLRSPTIPAALHEPMSYTMKEWDGMRDEGMHHFEYAFTAFESSFYDNEIVSIANSYNAPFLACNGSVDVPDMPYIINGNANITAIKIAEDGNGLIVRLTEKSGKAGKVEIYVPQKMEKAYKTDLKEDIMLELSINTDKITIDIRPYEIATIRLAC